MRVLKIDQKMGTSYDHEFNGLAENVQKTIEIMLRHVLPVGALKSDFTDYLPMCQYAYNTAEHASLGAGVTPY